jgi:hypothetical protein
MLKPNILVLLCATLVPIFLGFLWYNPRFGFGKAWMAATGMNPDAPRKMNMAVVFGLTALFAFIVAAALQTIVIHQFGIMSLLAPRPNYQPDADAQTMLNGFMEKYGHVHRTFGHGMLHGTLAGFMIALPVIGTNALFEGRKFKYIAINAGFWIVSMALMGGIIAAFT